MPARRASSASAPASAAAASATRSPLPGAGEHRLGRARWRWRRARASSYMARDHGGAAPRLLHVVRAPPCLRTDALQGLAMHCPRYWGIPGVTPERAARPQARLTHLGATTPREGTLSHRVLHDRVDDLRPQRAGQVVAHAREDHQPGARGSPPRWRDRPRRPPAGRRRRGSRWSGRGPRRSASVRSGAEATAPS